MNRHRAFIGWLAGALCAGLLASNYTLSALAGAAVFAVVCAVLDSGEEVPEC